MRKLALALLLLPTVAFAAPCTPRGFSYAYSHDGNSHHLSGGANVNDLVAVSNRFSGDFLWARLKGREYLIRDADTLTRVRAFFSPLRALEPEMKRVSEQENELDEQIDAIEDGESADRDEAKLDKLRAQRDAVQQRERELDRMEEKIECTAEKQLVTLIEESIKSGKARAL